MTFQELLQYHAGDHDCDVRGYSGRWMSNQTCLSVVGNLIDIRLLFSSVIKDVTFNDVDAKSPHPLYEVENIIDNCFDYCEDSMGKNDVVYYWPTIPFEQ